MYELHLGFQYRIERRLFERLVEETVENLLLSNPISLLRVDESMGPS